MKNRVVVVASTFLIVGISVALFWIRSKKSAEPKTKSTQIEAVELQRDGALANNNSSETMNSPSAGASDIAVGEDLKPLDVMNQLRRGAEEGNVSWSYVSKVLSSILPKNVKLMALQAFANANHMNRSAVYENTEKILEFLNSIGDMQSDEERLVLSDMLEKLNDDQNPKKALVDDFIQSHYEQFAANDPAKAKVFLNVMTDEHYLKSVMNGAGEQMLRSAAQDRIPQVGGPMMIKEVLQKDQFTIEQKITGMTRLTQNVDGESRGNMTDADALIVLSRSLDEKHKSGQSFYKAALTGIGLSNHKDLDGFMTSNLKNSLTPYRSQKMGGSKVSYQDVPEIAAMFGYLTSKMPSSSQVYPFFESEYDRMLNSGACPNTKADALIQDFVTFWQYSCEMSTDCSRSMKGVEAYKAIDQKSMALKNRCPNLG